MKHFTRITEESIYIVYPTNCGKLKKENNNVTANINKY